MILDRYGLEYNEYIRQREVQWSVEARGAARCAAWIDVLLPYLRVKQADSRLLREYCAFVLECPHPGSAGRVYGARELQILSIFGVSASMTTRPTRGARAAALASEPVAFDPDGLTQLDLAWLAGFFDGEGSIMMTKHLSRGIWYPMPVVKLNNTHMPVLPYVRAIMDAQGVAYTCVPYREGPQPRHRPHWVLETQGVSRSAPWLAALVPYLHPVGLGSNFCARAARAIGAADAFGPLALCG